MNRPLTNRQRSAAFGHPRGAGCALSAVREGSFPQTNVFGCFTYSVVKVLIVSGSGVSVGA